MTILFDINLDLFLQERTDQVREEYDRILQQKLS